MKFVREPIYGLDFIRFFAASAVFFYHVGFKFLVLPNETQPESNFQMSVPGWAYFSSWGWIGVQIFFVISGLVIAYSAEDNHWFDFLRSRVARLFPAMLICATLMAVIAFILSYFPLSEIAFLWLKSVTFFPIGPWITGQIWTMPIEIAFYAVIWLMILTRNLKHMEALAQLLAVTCTLYWFMTSFFHINDHFPRLTQLILLQPGCYFALGMLIFIIDRQGVTLSRLATAFVCVITAVLQIYYTAEVERNGLPLPDITVLAFCIWIAALAVIIASLHWKAAISKVLLPYAAIIRILGVMTYPVYLIHMHTGIPGYIFLLKAGIPPLAGLMITYFLTLAVALIISLWLEPPLHTYLNDLLKKTGALFGRSLRTKAGDFPT